MADFTSGVIDLGIVVGNVQRSINFYQQAIGFEKVGSFSVTPEMGGDSGLSNQRPFTAHVMQLPGSENGTKIKLIEFSDAVPCCDISYIHSVRGVRYLTVRVADIAAACRKAEAAGYPPLAKGPTRMAPPLPTDMWLAVVRDPDGNMIEFVGPNPQAAS